MIYNKKQPKSLITQMPLYLEQIRSLGQCPRLPAHSAVALCSVLPLPPGGYSPVLHHCWRYWCCWYYRQQSVSCCRLWCSVCRWGTSSWASAKDPHISCETHACGERERESEISTFKIIFEAIFSFSREGRTVWELLDFVSSTCVALKGKVQWGGGVKNAQK